MFTTFIKRISFFIIFFSHALVAETIDGVVFYDEIILNLENSELILTTQVIDNDGLCR
jgi:hypothetical protein